jgi:hypothetical protein
MSATQQLDAIAGNAGLPQQATSEMTAALENSPEFPDMVIEAPAALVSMIALYR